MKALLGIIVLIILVGGGYYWYTQNTTTPVIDSGLSDPFGGTNTGMNTNTETNTQLGATSTPSATPGTVREIIVTNSGMTFNPKTLSIKQGERVRVTFRNTGGSHDLRVEGYDVGTKVMSAGQSESFEFVADEVGEFEYYCSVGNHRAQGMRGTLTVTR